jgi:hypothetical protein
MEAVRRLLRPLVRLLLARQVTYPSLAALLKEIYVEVAVRDFPLTRKRQTDSRVNLLTGIHRKEIRRLRAVAHEEQRTPASISLGAQIVARWTSLPAYLDATGAPRPLPRQAPPRRGHSFESLVESVSRDIRPRAVLDEWLRLGVAHVDEHDRVTLDAAAFIPSKGFDEKAFYFGRNLRDHVAAAAHNLLGGSPPFVDRSVYYDGLTADSVAVLKELAEARGMEALQAVNREAMKLQVRDRSAAAARRRLNFGIYVYDDAERAAGPGNENDV